MGMLGSSFRGIDGPDPLEILEALAREVAHLQHSRVSPTDLERALTLLESDAIYQSQTVQGLAQRLGYFHVVAGGLEFEPRFVELARQVTPEDIQRVAQTYLTVDNLSVGYMLPDRLDVGTVNHDTIAAVLTDAYADVSAEYASFDLEPDANGIIRYAIPHGPVVIIQPDSSTPMFSVRAMALGGLLAETPETNGSQHMIAELLLSGTPTSDATEIALAVDGLAASLVGFSGRNSLGMRMTALSRDFDDGMALFADCLLNSDFPESELDRVRDETLAIIASQRDDLATTAFNLFHETLYGDHPYGLSMAGTEESVGGLSRETLLELRERIIDPRRMVVSIVGDVDPDAAVRSVVHLFSESRDDDVFEMPAVAAVPVVEETREVGDLRDRQQAHIVIGYPGMSMFDPDRYVVDVLTAVLGGQGGRLFLELRDRQSLAYSVGAYSTPGYDTGSFTFYIATSPEKIEQATDGIHAEVERLLAEGVTAEELENAQRYLIGRRDIGLQRMSARSSYYGFDELYGLGYDFGQTYPDTVSAITLEDVQRVAERLFANGGEVVTVIRPSAGEIPATDEPPVE